MDIDDISKINFSRSLSWSRISNVLYAGGSLNSEDNGYTILNWDLKYPSKEELSISKVDSFKKLLR